jgi:hypothetical protein
LTLNQRVWSTSFGDAAKPIYGWVETTWGANGFTDFATSLTEQLVAMCSNQN